MTRGSDNMEEGPDLSHLTPEERAIIESVMVRQKQEEEREQEIMRCDCISTFRFAREIDSRKGVVLSKD